jgi:hypothetical protein
MIMPSGATRKKWQQGLQREKGKGKYAGSMQDSGKANASRIGRINSGYYRVPRFWRGFFLANIFILLCQGVNLFRFQYLAIFTASLPIGSKFKKLVLILN